MIGWLMIYARIATFGVTRIFGLQASLADYVISFLGGREGANVMGGMVDNMKGMFGAAGGGAQRMPGMRSQPRRNPGGGGGGTVFNDQLQTSFCCPINGGLGNSVIRYAVFMVKVL